MDKALLNDILENPKPLFFGLMGIALGWVFFDLIVYIYPNTVFLKLPFVIGTIIGFVVFVLAKSERLGMFGLSSNAIGTIFAIILVVLFFILIHLSSMNLQNTQPTLINKISDFGFAFVGGIFFDIFVPLFIFALLMGKRKIKI